MTRPDPRAELLAGIPWDPDPLAVTEDDLVERRVWRQVLSQPGFREATRQALNDLAAGRGVPLEDIPRSRHRRGPKFTVARPSRRRRSLLSRLVAKVKGWWGW